MNIYKYIRYKFIVEKSIIKRKLKFTINETSGILLIVLLTIIVALTFKYIK